LGGQRSLGGGEKSGSSDLFVLGDQQISDGIFRRCPISGGNSLCNPGKNYLLDCKLNSSKAAKHVRSSRILTTNGDEMQFDIVAVSSIVTVVFVVAISLVYRDLW
jgi:hypothetical protein